MNFRCGSSTSGTVAHDHSREGLLGGQGFALVEV
jgi:hypothetical protein